MNRHKPECQASLRRLRTIHKQRFLAHAEKLRQEREVSREKIDLADQTD